ncbi:MAG: MFS transporter [Flavobacteriales bacterium]|nr:MFS transporter [Flavobacteriales bacterium]
MKKHLFALYACLFVVMIGFGITLPVLPFYVERLALEAGVSQGSIVLHVTLLTGMFALMQLFFAPLWGRWSDRIGRRPLILIGIGGYVIAQVLFGLSTSLWMLYGARVLGGILSSAMLPVAAAYVADLTTDKERSKGMAWLGTSVSLGFVVGPALGGMLSATDLHFRASFGHFLIDGFSVPFFAAALLGLLALFAALRWLPESRSASDERHKREEKRADWRGLVRDLGPLLGLAFAVQFGLAVFEAIFALYAQAKFNFGTGEVGAVFMVCGLVMAVFQIGGVGFFAGRIRELYQIRAGFGLMGISLALLVLSSTKWSVFGLVALLAMGTAFIIPNVATLISKRGESGRTGSALGIGNAANSLGQASGPLFAGALFIWQVNAPYLITGLLLVSVAYFVGWKAFSGREMR